MRREKHDHGTLESPCRGSTSPSESETNLCRAERKERMHRADKHVPKIGPREVARGTGRCLSATRYTLEFSIPRVRPAIILDVLNTLVSGARKSEADHGMHLVQQALGIIAGLARVDLTYSWFPDSGPDSASSMRRTRPGRVHLGSSAGFMRSSAVLRMRS